MTDVLKDTVFAMKRLSDYTAGIINPYEQSTIRKSSESFGHWTARVKEKRDRDINTLIESLFFFINSEQARSADSKRMDFVASHSYYDLAGVGRESWGIHRFMIEEGERGTTIREAIDRSLAEESAGKSQDSSESQASLRLETPEPHSKTESNESSPGE